ncbi:MAG: dihydropyrimidinase [Candidatus Sericytochromatia bacterium]|nr:dihydropyrimidinase [Candidatus Sericytochromatia bacterium]
MELVITNGTIVNASETFRCDVGVQNGRIVALGTDLSGDENLDATGKYLFPGLIDAHTYLEHPSHGTRTADNFFSGTRAAACGGVTTVIDVAVQGEGGSLLEAIEARHALAGPQAVVDYALHASITRFVPETFAELPELFNEGAVSLRIDLARLAAHEADDGALLALLETAGHEGILVVAQAENGAITERLQARALADGRVSPEHFPGAHPAFAEIEAVQRLLLLAEAAGVAIYFSALSTHGALVAINAARANGQPVYAEATPSHMLLDSSLYGSLDGQHYIVEPPLRVEADRAALWRGLTMGSVQVVASHHRAFTTAQKALGDSFATTPPGIAGTETLLSLLYTHGVKGGKLSVNQLVGAVSTNPAELFGLHNKGAIAIGKDADLVIFNPNDKRILTASALHSEGGHTVFDGWELNGYPETTISRGRIVYEQGRFTGEKGMGRFVGRTA